MIKVTVMYPKTEGSTFDMGYYLESHMPMVRRKLGAACTGTMVEHGLGGGQPGTAPTYAAIGSLMFDSVDAFQTAFAPHAAEILADIPNYTNVEPVIQISDIKSS
jgi:uncharacterized protein (TIGR02118 family)